MVDWEYDIFGCTSCGSALCDGDCPEAFANYEREQEMIAKHVAMCIKDGFCEICQCM